MAAKLPILGLKTHAQKVCSLYKRALRNLQAWEHNRDEYRYEAVLLRARFDQNKDEKDLIKATILLQQGEKELFGKEHPEPLKWPGSPGGCAYQREVEPPDWILDFWHPLEKAHYPEYFKRREQRKKEYVVWWEQQYGKPPATPPHH